eukprot:scaffold18_cov401-Prasinococcus_capsulatus_cf.AAC.16
MPSRRRNAFSAATRQTLVCVKSFSCMNISLKRSAIRPFISSEYAIGEYLMTLARALAQHDVSSVILPRTMESSMKENRMFRKPAFR